MHYPLHRYEPDLNARAAQLVVLAEADASTDTWAAYEAWQDAVHQRLEGLDRSQERQRWQQLAAEKIVVRGWVGDALDRAKEARHG